jgi:hypothetical protein
MALTISNAPKRKFETTPEGVFVATLVETKDLGIRSTKFGDQRQVRFAWELDSPLPAAGGKFRAFEVFNFSWAERSKLRKAVENLLGTELPSTFDLETLLGTKARLVLKHESSGGRVFANIKAVISIRPEGPEIELAARS